MEFAERVSDYELFAQESVWQNYKRFVPIPKTSSAERIEANKDLYDFELDSEDMEELDGLDQGAAGRVSGIDPAHLPDWCAVRPVVSWCNVCIEYQHCFRIMFGKSASSTWSTWITETTLQRTIIPCLIRWILHRTVLIRRYPSLGFEFYRHRQGCDHTGNINNKIYISYLCPLVNLSTVEAVRKQPMPKFVKLFASIIISFYSST